MQSAACEVTLLVKSKWWCDGAHDSRLGHASTKCRRHALQTEPSEGSWSRAMSLTSEPSGKTGPLPKMSVCRAANVDSAFSQRQYAKCCLWPMRHAGRSTTRLLRPSSLECQRRKQSARHHATHYSTMGVRVACACPWAPLTRSCLNSIAALQRLLR